MPDPKEGRWLFASPCSKAAGLRTVRGVSPLATPLRNPAGQAGTAFGVLALFCGWGSPNAHVEQHEREVGQSVQVGDAAEHKLPPRVH